MSSLTVRIAFLSGEEHGITVPIHATVDDLRATAEMEMRKSLGKLISASGTVLPASSTLAQEDIKDGDVITAVFQEVTVAAATSAFAVIRSDATVVAWGIPQVGGDCSAVQEQLQHVQSIQATWDAFAALRTDGTVVTWGDPFGGGDSSSVQSQLCNVCHVQSTARAFAAIKADGSVVTWGSRANGGDCSAVRDQLYSVQQIQSTRMAFAALREDGSVVTWGESASGGDSSAVRDELQEGVLSIYAQDHDFPGVMSFPGFAAIKAGGRFVFCGGGYAAPRGLIHSGLDDIAHLQVVGGRWAAASKNGHLALSLEPIRGDRCLLVPDCASSLAGCPECLAVLQKDGTVQFWGHCAPNWLRNELSNVVRVRMAGGFGAALRSDGSVVLWEFTERGAISCASAKVHRQLTDVKDIQANPCAFAFLRRDGSVVAWGDDTCGGNSAAVQPHLKEVVSIQASYAAFAAIRRDGSVVTWGDPRNGGESSLVQEQLGRRVANDNDKQAAFRAKQAGAHNRVKSQVLKKPSKKYSKK
ncbi:USP [Symbiodinium sp. CCMP2592]|nr:USP [Symbiodinium sp. CCMP2592]